MDPITIMSILVLAGFIGAGADLATGGLVRAEFGGGARGAAGYLGSAGRKRWQESKRLARQERMKTPTGRAVQFILDELGGLGRGLVRGWRSGARRGRKQWRECLNGQPLPAVRAWRGASESARTWLEQRADKGTPIGPNGAGQDPVEARTGTPNGDPERVPEREPEREPERAWWDPNGITEDPFLGGPEQDPNGDPDDDPLPPRCPDCGMPIVTGDLNAHRLGRDRCPHADPNETPNDDPEQSTQPTRTEGTTVADINSAPAAIALFEAFRGRFEEPEALLTALRDEIASAADSMGDFAIGGEGDLSAGPQAALDAVVQAKEALDGYLSALHLEYDASIEAAEAKAAAAHRPMQEV